jgi:hypothetical protein
MGVRGLQAYIDHRGDFHKWVNLSQIAQSHYEKTGSKLVIVADGLGVLYHLLRRSNNDWRFGGQYAE